MYSDRRHRGHLLKALVGILITLACVQVASVPAKAGIPIAPYLWGPVQLAGGKIFHSSPTLVDLDPWNGNGLEIIIGSVKTGSGEGSWPAVLSVLRADGSVWWEKTVQGSINSAPAVDDIDNDGQLEIVVSTGGENYPQTVGGVVAYERNGTLKWSTNTLDRQDPRGGGPNGYPDGVFASPSIADVNNDGAKEVIVGAWDFRMYVVRGADGAHVPPWPIEMLDTTWSSPAIADLDRDGYSDIAFGGDLCYNSAACTQDGGLFRAMRHDGSHLPGFSDPVGCDPSAPLTRGRYVAQSIHSSPAIGDLDHDGDLEIVVGSGRAFPGGHWVKVWDSEGRLLRTLGTDGYVFSSPALADLNGDGYLDIVAGTGGGTVYAWDYHNSGTLWAVQPSIVSGVQGIPIASSPTVADIDSQHDGPEVLLGFGPEVAVLSASGQQLTASTPNSAAPTLWVGLSPVNGSPAVADINGDDVLEIVVGGSYAPPGASSFDYRGYVFAWHWPGSSGSAAEAVLPWPMFRHDPWHSGVAEQDSIVVSPSQVVFLYQYGSGDPDPSSAFKVVKIGTGSLDWVASYSPTVEGSDSGNVQYGSPSVVPFTVQASSYVTGTYDLGITVLAPGVASDTPHRIDITLSVGQIRANYLPVVSGAGLN